MKDFFAVYWLEMFLMLVLLYYAFDGYYRGFILLAMETVGFLVALLGAMATYRFAAIGLEEQLGLPFSFASAIAFFVIWGAIDILWPFLVRRIYKRVKIELKISPWNRAAGLLPGLVNGTLLLSVLLTVVTAFPLPGDIKDKVTESAVARPMLALAASFDKALKPLLGPIAQSSLNLLTVKPESGEMLALHFTVHDGASNEKSEAALFKLVNEERVRYDLPELKFSDDLRDVGRKHSNDMLQRGYFAHVNPEGETPADRVDKDGIRYGIVGENLALAPTVAIAHKGLMESPGHRANILRPEFRKIGIGVIDGGVYGKMFTQVFSD
jgi:uncharacterized protein YkwD